MTSQNVSKINKVLRGWPKGTVAVYDWLKTQGVYRQLADVYVKSAWFDRVGRGVFKRSGEAVDWTGALYAIQKQMKLSVHAAGKTALALAGLAHYVPAGSRQTVVLMGAENKKLPAWFLKYDWGVKIRYTMSGLFGTEKNLGLTEHTVGDYSVKISSPERAMLEVCYDVPDKESFEEASLLMEGLGTFRPALVEKLLLKCESVKAKRLFMLLAEEQKMAWTGKVNSSKVDFGSGKRSLCREEQGEYHSKYQMVVPKLSGSEPESEPA